MPLWDVRVTVTNAGGSDTKTRTAYVRVSPVRAITDTGLSPSDSPARVLGAHRSISDNGVSFSEAVAATGSPPVPSLTTRVAFGTNPFDTSPTWTTLDANRPLAFTIQRGRTSELEQFQPGTYDVTLDSHDRLFDPANTAGAYYGTLKPRKRINQRVTILGVTYDLFDGFVNRWPQSFQGLWQQCDVPATDAMAIFANQTITGSRPAERTDQRLTWVLDQIGFPGAWRTSTLAGRMMIAADFEAVNALDHIRDIEAAENGEFFIDGANNSIFQARYDRITSYNTSAYTFSDSPTGSELPFTNFEPDYDVDHIFNHVVGQQNADGAAVHEFTDSSSTTEYGPSTKTFQSDAASDTEIEAQTLAYLALYAQPLIRVATVTLNPQMDARLWAPCLGLLIGQRITIKARYLGKGSVLTHECRIEGVRHEYQADPLTWTTTFNLSPVPPAEVAGYWLLGDATYSNLGVTTVLAP
jgi:PKD repeat protein